MIRFRRRIRRVRHRVPTILQLEATECGAASLGMILAHHGRFVPLETLRVACGVSRDGAKASAIVRAGDRFGLVVKGFRRETAALREMPFPLIVHWNFAHFLVVEGYDDRGWFLNDPANGPRRCSESEFDASFTGIALTAAPGPDFVVEGRRPSVLGQLLRAAGDRRGALPAFALLGLFLLVPTLVVPQILSRFGDHLAGGPGLEAAEAAAALMIAIVVQALVLLVQGHLAVRLTSKISVRLGASMVLRMLRLPMAFHVQRGAAMLAQRAGIASQLSDAISALTVSALTAALTAAASTVILLAFDLPSGLLAAAIGITTMVVLRSVMRRSQDESMRLIRDSMELGAVVTTSLSQIESVKASGSEGGVIAQGVAAQNTFMSASQRLGQRAVMLSLWPMLIGGFGSLAIAALATRQVATGSMSIGSFLSVQALAAGVIGPLGVIAVSLEQTQTLRASLEQVEDIMNAAEDPALHRSLDEDLPAVIAGAVELREITFGYNPTAEPTIRGFDLRVAPGQRVALVGPSGCGKSTVSRLVTGLYAPWSGDILLDGRPRAGHAREVLNDAIALVDQEVSIFAGTIRDNVTLWDATIPDTDVLAAIADAQLEDEVARRPGGLDAELAEGGADLSGGQRQRLEIARALVRNPSIIVMDEATSALDPVTEMRIDQAVRRRGITAVIIAHRLSTIRDSDEIICLDRGVVIERGTHTELIAVDGAYAALVAAA